MFTPQLKKISTIALLTVLTTSQVQAGWFNFGQKEEKTEALNTILNVTLPANQEAAQRSALQALAAAMTPSLIEIQKLLKEEKSLEALTLAKSVLDDVQTKTGIDPKAKLRENFLISTTFNENSSNMASLPVDQQQMVIRTVKDFRGGLYLDILNLTKRTTLLYIKSLHQEIKKNGGLTAEDRNKIIRDLALATIVPMPIQDKAGKIIYVFDEEVANEDHIYMFNREIKMYLLESKDLAINETAFIEYREKLKLSMTGGTYKPESKSTEAYKNALECVRTASMISDSNSKAEAQKSCLDKYLSSFTTFDQCYQIAYANDSYIFRLEGTKSCFKKFNQ